jgi:BASS family bile acid:Na+ symporter
MLSDLETQLLSVMMMVIMLGMGASMTFKDFAISLRNPAGVAIGLVATYLLTPIVGVTLATTLQLPPAYAVGLILMACLPGGTTSNIFNYFSRGVLSLSLLMTVVSTLFAVVLVPITLGIFTSGIEGEWRIPPENVARVLFVLLVPTLIGMAIRRWNANVGAVIEMLGGVLGVVVILFLIVSWVPRNHQLLATTSWQIYFASIGLGVFGFGIGYLFARLVRQDARRARTIAIETGIQNGPLGVLIVLLTFSGQQQQDVLLVPVLYSLFIVLTSAMLTVWFRRISMREELARDNAKIGALATR